MNEKNSNIRISKFLSHVLRHSPDKIGLILDAAGWTEVNQLISKMNDNGQAIDFGLLDHLVQSSDKQRFAFNADKTMIRANQGHSIKIELGFTPTAPPAVLYHGTGAKNEASILKSGLDKRKRHHVHLSPDVKTAIMVGQRHGKPIVFEVKAKEMYTAGFVFYKSENGVWLTDSVPAKYLKPPPSP